MRSRLPGLVAGLVTLAFGLACALFVWQPGLSTFADDSVSYLVMAQVFSPWQAASPAVAAAFAREAIYPPLFPLVLALAGAAHDFAWAHGLTALLLAAALPEARRTLRNTHPIPMHRLTTADFAAMNSPLPPNC